MLLRSSGCNVPNEDLTQLPSIISQQCPWYPAKGSLEMASWEHIGHWLKNALVPGNISHLHTWNLGHIAIHALQEKPDENGWQDFIPPPCNPLPPPPPVSAPPRVQPVSTCLWHHQLAPPPPFAVKEQRAPPWGYTAYCRSPDRKSVV